MGEIIRTAKVNSQVYQMSREIAGGLRKIKETMAKHGLKESDVEEIANDEREPDPSFPINILMLAIIKDGLDAFATLTLIGGLVLTTIFFVIFWFWFKGKIKGKAWKQFIISKALKSLLEKRFIIILLGEALPLVGALVPGTTIMVLMAHYRHTKVVKTLNEILEIIHGIKGRIKAIKKIQES